VNQAGREVGKDIWTGFATRCIVTCIWKSHPTVKSWSVHAPVAPTPEMFFHAAARNRSRAIVRSKRSFPPKSARRNSARCRLGVRSRSFHGCVRFWMRHTTAAITVPVWNFCSKWCPSH